MTYKNAKNIPCSNVVSIFGDFFQVLKQLLENSQAGRSAEHSPQKPVMPKTQFKSYIKKA